MVRAESPRGKMVGCEIIKLFFTHPQLPHPHLLMGKYFKSLVLPPLLKERGKVPT
jgi:hypothetical protein